MRLSELRPEWRRVYKDFTPETGGEPTDNFDLTFVCPTCKYPYTITVRIGPRASAEEAVWPASPMPPNAERWVEQLTLLASINNTESGHGRKHPTCAYHGHITNGEVTSIP